MPTCERSSPRGGRGGAGDLSETPGAVPASERRVEVLESVEALRPLREEWASFRPSPRAGPDGFLDEIRLSGGSLEPCVLVQRRGGEVEALLVARTEAADLSSRVGYLRVLRKRIRALTVLPGGALRRSPDVDWAPLVDAAWARLRAGGLDAIHFRQVGADSGLLEAVRARVSALWRDESGPPAPHWTLDLPGDFESLMQRLDGHRRKEFRRYRRVLERDHPGAVAVRRTDSTDGVEGLCERMDRIASGTYQRGIGAGFVNDPATAGLVAAAAARGELRAFELQIGDRTVAYWVGRVANATLHLDYTGYEHAFARYEPGTVLLLEAFASAIGEGVRSVDYGIGDAAYKRRFGAAQREERDVYVFRPGVRTAWLQIARSSVGTVTAGLKRAAVAAGVFDPLRKAWRERARRRAAESSRGNEGASAPEPAESEKR